MLHHLTEYSLDGGEWITAYTDEEAGPGKSFNLPELLPGVYELRLRITPLPLGEAGPPVISNPPLNFIVATGDAVTLSEIQSVQFESMQATILLTGTASQANALQVTSGAGKIVITGQIAESQIAQSESLSTGSSVITGSIAESQQIQVAVMIGTESLSGAISETQQIQIETVPAVQKLIGTISGTQQVQAEAASGSSLAVVTGVCGQVQALQTESATGTMGDPPYLFESFTGTPQALLGGNFSVNSVYGNSIRYDSVGRIYGSATQNNVCCYYQEMPQTDYEVSVRVDVLSNDSFSTGIVARLIPGVLEGLIMARVLSWNIVQLGTPNDVIGAIIPGGMNGKTLTLRVKGDTASVLVDGVLIAGISRTGIPAGPGYVGVYSNQGSTDTTGIHIDNFRVDLSTAVTSLVAETQAVQTEALQGSIKYTGVVAATQSAQTEAISVVANAPNTVSGTIVQTQQAQQEALAGGAVVVGVTTTFESNNMNGWAFFSEDPGIYGNEATGEIVSANSDSGSSCFRITTGYYEDEEISDTTGGGLTKTAARSGGIASIRVKSDDCWVFFPWTGEPTNGQHVQGSSYVTLYSTSPLPSGTSEVSILVSSVTPGTTAYIDNIVEV